MEYTLTQFEEYLYNTYLKTSRTKNNQPYKLRKNFSNLDESIVFCLKKLSTFFNKHTHISPEDFFAAPFTVYNDEPYFELSFYNSLKAVKAYTLYQNFLQTQAPDSDMQLECIQKSLKYILNFCKENSITLAEYITHKDGINPTFLLHLKEYKVNIYTLLGFKNFEHEFRKIDSEIVRFMLNEQIYEQIQTTKVKLYGSTTAKRFIESGLLRINDILQKTS